MTQILIAFLVSFVFIFVVISFASITSQREEYKYYRKTYDALKNREYVFDSQYGFSNSYYYFFTKPELAVGIPFSRKESIILFGKGDIKLKDSDGYIFKTFFTYFDPYSFYWLFKINRWKEKHKHLFKKQGEFGFQKKPTTFIKNKSFIKKEK